MTDVSALSKSYLTHTLKCPLIMRMQLACTLATMDGGKRIYSAQNKSLSLHYVIAHSFPRLVQALSQIYAQF